MKNVLLDKYRYQNQHPQKDRAREVITGFPRPVFFCACLSALCFLAPFRLLSCLQNAVYVLLDNVIFPDFLFQLGKLFNTSRSTIQYRRTSSFEILKKYLEEHADEWDEW